MPDDIVYRTPGPWGAGKGADLTPREVDRNFYRLVLRVAELRSGRAIDPVVVDEIVSDGRRFTVRLTNDEVFGPFDIPFSAFQWRGDWQPATAYAELDAVVVEGSGIHVVLGAHVSAASFDPLARNAARRRLYRPLVPLTAADLGGVSDVDTGLYQVGLSDVGRTLRAVNPFGQAFLIPGPPSLVWPMGGELRIVQATAAPAVILAGSGATFHHRLDRDPVTGFLGGVVRVKGWGGGNFDLFGDLGVLPTEPPEPTEPATELPEPTEPPTEAATEVTEPAPTETEPDPTEPPTATEPEPGDDLMEFTDLLQIANPGVANVAFSDVEIGTPDPARTIFLMVHWEQTSTRTLNAIPGFTRVARAAGDAVVRNTELWAADIAEASTLATLELQFSNNPRNVVVAVYRSTAFSVGDAGVVTATTPGFWQQVYVPPGAALLSGLSKLSGGSAALFNGDNGYRIHDDDAGLGWPTGGIGGLPCGGHRGAPPPNWPYVIANSNVSTSGTDPGPTLIATFGDIPTEFPPIPPMPTLVDHQTAVAATPVSLPISLGDPDADRLIVLSICWAKDPTGNREITALSVTPAGGDPVSFTRAVRGHEATTTRTNAELWYGHVPAGVSGTLGITVSGSGDISWSVAVHRLTGLNGAYAPLEVDAFTSGTGLTTTGDWFQMAIDQPAGRLALACYAARLIGEDIRIAPIVGIEADIEAHAVPAGSGQVLSCQHASGITTGGEQAIEFFTDHHAGKQSRAVVAVWPFPSGEAIPHEPPTETEPLPTEPPLGEDSALTAHRAGLNFLTTGLAHQQFHADLGDPDADRLIVAVVGWKNSSTDGQSEMTGLAIGATPLARVARAIAGPANSNVEIWQAHMPSGTSGNVLASFDGHPGPNRNYSAAIYRIVGLDGQYTPVATLDDTSLGASVSDTASQENGLAILGAFGGTNGNESVAVHFGEGIVRDVPAHTAWGMINRSAEIARLHGTIGRAPTTEVPAALGATAGSTPTGWAMRLAGAVWALPVEPTA